MRTTVRPPSLCAPCQADTGETTKVFFCRPAALCIKMFQMLQLPRVAPFTGDRQGRVPIRAEECKRVMHRKVNPLMAVVLVCRGHLDHEVQQEWQVPGKRWSGCGSACLGGVLESGRGTGR